MRYGKPHTCFNTLQAANEILPCADPQGRSGKGPTPFVFAGPDEFKYDDTVDIYTKYKMYIASKPWVKDNLHLEITLDSPTVNQNGYD